MQKEKIKEIMDRLLLEVEEEDISISLFSSLYQNESELHFFTENDRERVLQILKKISDDSKQHKIILEKIVVHLGEKYLAGRIS